MSFSVALKGRPLSRTELLLPLAWEKLTGTLSMARLMYLEKERDTSRIEGVSRKLYSHSVMCVAVGNRFDAAVLGGIGSELDSQSWLMLQI